MRSRFSWTSRTNGAGSGMRVGVVVGSGHEGHELVGTELLHQRLGVDAQLLDGLGLHGLDPQPLLGARHLVAVDGVGELAQVVLQDGDLAPHLAQRLVALGALLLGGRALAATRCRGVRDEGGGVGGSAAHGLGHRRLALAPLLAGSEPLAGGELVAGRALEGVGATLEGAAALLLGAQGQAQLGLRGATAAGLELEPVALVGAGVLRLGRLRAGLLEPLGETGELARSLSSAAVGVGDGALGALGLGLGATARWPRGGRAARPRPPSWRRSRAAARGRPRRRRWPRGAARGRQ